MRMSPSRSVVSRFCRRSSTCAKRRKFRTLEALSLSSIFFLRISRKANASVQCPVQEGTYEIIHTVKLPKEIPPGELLLNGDDKNDAERVS